MIDQVASALTSTLGALFKSGGTHSCERPHSLHGIKSRVLASIELAADAALGATTVQLRVSATDSTLAGVAPKGLVLTIGGAPYALAADLRAEGSPAAATLASGLLASHVAGTAVLLATHVAYSLPGCARQDLDVTRFPAEMQTRLAFGLLVPKLQGPAGFAPRVNDRIVTPTGEVAKVWAIPFDAAGAWELACGAP